MQIDLNALSTNEELLEDLYNIIAIELRKMKNLFLGTK